MATLSNIGIPITPVPAYLSQVNGPLIMPHGYEGLGQSVSGGNWGVSAGWPSANLGLFFPMNIGADFAAVKAFLQWGTTAGSNNFDIGVYSMGGTRLASLGATGGSGTSDIQVATFSYTILVRQFYLALSADSTSFTPFRSNSYAATFLAGLGVREMASAYPLPSSAVFADTSAAYLPMFGLSNRSTL